MNHETVRLRRRSAKAWAVIKPVLSINCRSSHSDKINSFRRNKIDCANCSKIFKMSICSNRKLIRRVLWLWSRILRASRKHTRRRLNGFLWRTMNVNSNGLRSKLRRRTLSLRTRPRSTSSRRLLRRVQASSPRLRRHSSNVWSCSGCMRRRRWRIAPSSQKSIKTTSASSHNLKIKRSTLRL